VSSSWKSKVNKLLSGHRKTTPDILRLNAAMLNGAVYSYCPYSDYTTQTGAGATGGGSAPTGTGMLVGNADEATIHSVRVSGCFDNRIQSAVTSTDGDQGSRQRIILVWFQKAAALPTSTGVLPPIGEVLDVNILQTWQPTTAQDQKTVNNAFTILSDRSFDCGTNIVDSTGLYAVSVGGTNYRKFDYTIKVNRQVKFMSPANSTFPGGHFDLDIDSGQVNKGLLMLYVFGTGSQNVITSLSTRVDFTI